MRAHRLFVQDDVTTLRSAASELADLGFDAEFYAEAEALARKVDAMLLGERRDGRSDALPRFTWEDVTLLERLATLPLERVAEHLLGLGVGVDVGGVERGDPRVERGVHALRGDLVLDLRAVREPVAVDDFGDLQAGAAQLSVVDHDRKSTADAARSRAACLRRGTRRA